MTQESHPDTATDYHALKAITRGGTQAADDQAMEAMWRAIERGESKEEAEKQFSETYQKGLHGKDSTALEGNNRRIS